MSNSIRNINGSLPTVQVELFGTAGSASPNTVTGNGGDKTEAPASDSTELSPLADLMQTATTQASSISPFRTDLVAQLKSAIANGSYKPDPTLVASRVAAAIGQI